MTREQLYDAYLLWEDDESTVSLSRLFENPFANSDIFEDEHRVINRLFYLTSKWRDGHLDMFFFFEENEFLKDQRGDLHLRRSSFHLFHPSQISYLNV